MPPPPSALLCVLGAFAIGACGDGGPAATSPVCQAPCGPVHLARLDLVAGRPGGPGWVDGTLTTAHFADPWTMATDGQGHLYVADGETVRVIDAAANRVTTLAGAYRNIGCAEGAGAQASFNAPGGLAFGGGALYITDSENHTVRKIDVGTGAVTTVAGACQQAGAVDATGSDARFQLPSGIVFDATGQDLYIADTDNDVIRVLAIGSGAVTTVAGTAGSVGATDGVGPAALFRKPTAITIDASGALYVVDSRNFGVRKVVPGAGPGTGVVSTVATWAVMPNGLAIDRGNLLVSLADHRLVSLAPGGAETPLAGSQGAKGFVDGIGTAARFDGPAGLLNDGAGTLYVADEANAAIRRIALARADVGTFAGVDPTGYLDGPGAAALFASPQGLAADASVVYVADTDNDVIRRVTLATGAVTTLAGAAGKVGRADGPPDVARFDHPKGLALDGPARRLYVVDAGNRTLRVVDLASGAVSSLALSAAAGDPYPGLSQPAGIALGGGRLFVTDYDNDTVLSIDVGQARVTTLAGQAGTSGGADGAGAQATFYGPAGIAFDGAGHLYVADSLNDTVRKIVVATATVSTLAGEPAVQGDNDGVGAAAHFSSPTSVVADASGDVLVSDLQNNRVRRIDAASRKVTTLIGGPIPGVRLGPLPAQLTLPGPLALTPSGGLLVVSESAVLLAH
jgi:sugar lactone lactonase YvrE